MRYEENCCQLFGRKRIERFLFRIDPICFPSDAARTRSLIPPRSSALLDLQTVSSVSRECKFLAIDRAASALPPRGFLFPYVLMAIGTARYWENFCSERPGNAPIALRGFTNCHSSLMDSRLISLLTVAAPPDAEKDTTKSNYLS